MHMIKMMATLMTILVSTTMFAGITYVTTGTHPDMPHGVVLMGYEQNKSTSLLANTYELEQVFYLSILFKQRTTVSQWLKQPEDLRGYEKDSDLDSFIEDWDATILQSIMNAQSRFDLAKERKGRPLLQSLWKQAALIPKDDVVEYQVRACDAVDLCRRLGIPVMVGEHQKIITELLKRLQNHAGEGPIFCLMPEANILVLEWNLSDGHGMEFKASGSAEGVPLTVDNGTQGIRSLLGFC